MPNTPGPCPATGGPHEYIYEDGRGESPSGWHCDECGASPLGQEGRP